VSSLAFLLSRVVENILSRRKFVQFSNLNAKELSRKEIGIMKSQEAQKNRQDFYELALLLADGQARKDKAYSWSDFIDNLSQICDEFAYSIHPKEKPHRGALPSRYRSYRM
jgi:hypothetical protein